MKQCWHSVGRSEGRTLFGQVGNKTLYIYILCSLSNQRRKEITTQRNDCYSVLNVYFVKWLFSVSNLLKFHVISPVSFYKFKNLPCPKAGAASAKVHALIDSPAIAVDGEQ
jgi:hypothetical protein